MHHYDGTNEILREVDLEEQEELQNLYHPLPAQLRGDRGKLPRSHDFPPLKQEAPHRVRLSDHREHRDWEDPRHHPGRQIAPRSFQKHRHWPR